MTDFLVQRYILNAPNSMNGAWVDEGMARDLKADEGAVAVTQVADPGIEGERRAIKWEHVSVHNVAPGPAQVTLAEKVAPDQPVIGDTLVIGNTLGDQGAGIALGDAS